MNEKQGYPSLDMLDWTIYQAVEFEALRNVDSKFSECYESLKSATICCTDGVVGKLIN